MTKAHTNGSSDALRPSEIASRLSVQVNTVLRWIRDGHLCAINVCASRKSRPSYRILLSSFEVFLRNRGAGDTEVQRLTRTK